MTPGALLLALAADAMAAGLWRKSRANGLRRGLTRDCGYAGSTARMQYGRLPACIRYGLAGLIALSFFVRLGGRR